MCTCSSLNTFPFASQEFALVGDTADARYPAFDISQPDSFIDDTLKAHINMDVAHNNKKKGWLSTKGPIYCRPLVHSYADIQVCQQN